MRSSQILPNDPITTEHSLNLVRVYAVAIDYVIDAVYREELFIIIGTNNFMAVQE